jgi:hypothetical protein
MESRKSYVDHQESSEFNNKYIRKNLNQMPILSTGGYNDTFLKFIANCFNTKIVKCREYMLFVITAVEYLNKWTNDCFFSYSKPAKNVLNYTGKLD